MSEAVTYTLAAVLACSALSYVACLVIQSFPSALKRYGGLVLAFGAGAMLGDVFLHILPHSAIGVTEESLVRNGYAFMVGIVGSFIIESFIGAIQVYSNSHIKRDSKSFSFLNLKPMAVTNLLCDLVHNGVDGVSIALAFMAGPKIGLTTTLAVLAHELAQELGDFVVLVHSGMSVRQATICNVAVSFSALFTAATTLYLGQGMDPNTQNLFVSAAGGAFLYMALVDILPEALEAQGCQVGHNHGGEESHPEQRETKKTENEEDNSKTRLRKPENKASSSVKSSVSESRVHQTRGFVKARLLVVVGVILGVGATALVSLLEDHDHHVHEHHGHSHGHSHVHHGHKHHNHHDHRHHHHDHKHDVLLPGVASLETPHVEEKHEHSQHRQLGENPNVDLHDHHHDDHDHSHHDHDHHHHDHDHDHHHHDHDHDHHHHDHDHHHHGHDHHHHGHDHHHHGHDHHHHGHRHHDHHHHEGCSHGHHHHGHKH